MEKEKLLEEITKNIKDCKKCRLCRSATNAVPGEGNINSKMVFIGEAPGFNEDVTGRPFVGRAGKLLETFLKEIGYKREDVWIGNIVKHRPPENRDPLPDEIATCKPFLELQLKTIHPVLVVTLGRFAMNYFYRDGKISRDRGNLIRAADFLIYPVYHPAAALRGNSMMNDLRVDFKRIPEVLKKAEEILELGVKLPQISGQDFDGQLNLGL
ncbi:MAG: uracil-DNA glycosylase [Patescibacteria group bacterium]|nr:uracil-DNA glycosylase [Patescibacteria group bacterium]MBU1953107.1 uracil-DNA glycosylase [Patescibacteria group bacterium]